MTSYGAKGFVQWELMSSVVGQGHNRDGAKCRSADQLVSRRQMSRSLGSLVWWPNGTASLVRDGVFEVRLKDNVLSS
ncbi:hypothetical protein R1flu_011713 [Riccia fluitans]|uniref:Uncharacterized protein n=1 Tax=Riccia fluitans TaxID=41844 RepID=A0ABD1Z8K7_9MARC